jgi:hypothetical protein
MTDREQLCKWFTELTGGHWHEYKIRCGGGRSYLECSCGHCAFLGEKEKQNPTYTNPADVLRVMMEFLNEDNLVKFARTVGIDYPIWGPIYIELKYIIEPDALLKAAVEFLKEGKK